MSKYKVALDKDPLDPSALRALGEQAAAEGNRQEMLDYLTREAGLCEQPQEKADLLLRAGRVRREKLNDAEGALRDFRNALAAYPLSRAAREEEWRLLIDLGRWEELASSLLAEADALKELNPRHAQALQLIRADVLEFRLDDTDGAEKVCSQVIEQNGKRLAHVLPMEVQERQGRWEELNTTFKALEDSAASFEEKAAFANLRLYLLECRLDKPEDAEALLVELLESSPGDSASWHAMALLAVSELAFTHENEAGFVDALSKLAAFTEAESKPPSARWRAALLHRQGDTVQTSQDEAAVLEKYCKAHALSPDDPRHLRAMIRMQGTTGHEKLLASQKALSEIQSGPKLSSAFELFLGRTLDIGLGRTDQALAAYKKARQLAPSLHLAEIEAEALRRLKRWPELDQLLKEQAETTKDDSLKAALLVERGQILQGHLNQPKEAANLFWQALAKPATSLGLARNVARAYADIGDNENLVQAIIEQKQLVEDPAYLAHLGLRAADLWLRLDRSDEAIKSLSSVIDIDGENIEALLMLEQIYYVQKSFQDLYDSKDRILTMLDHETDSAAAKTVLEQIGNAQKGLQDLYYIQERILSQLDHEDDAAYAKAVRLDHAGLLLGGLNNEQWALVILRQILEIFPDDPAVLIELRNLAYRGARWEEYFEMASREADALGRHPMLLWRAAQAAWGRLDQTKDALRILNEMVDNGSSTVILLETIKMMLFFKESWMPWLSTAEKLAPLLDETGRVLLYFEMARVHQWRFSSLDTASQYYGRIAQLEPDSYEAHEYLCMINLEKRNFENQKKVLAKLASLEHEPAMRAAYHFRCADLDEMSGALDDAQENLKIVIENAPDDLAALRRLERIYSSTQNTKAQIDVLQKEIKLRREPRVLVLLLLRQAALWETLNNSQEAIACYRDVLSHNPNELDPIERLTHLYSQEKKWQEFQENLERHAGVATDPKRKVELLTQLAAVWEQKLGNPNPAIASHVAALEIDPNLLPNLVELERLYGITESREEEFEILERMLELATKPDEQHRIHFKMGGIHEQKKDDSPAAIDCFVKALLLKPDHPGTLDALERLYDQEGDAARLVPLLEKKAELLPQERVRLYLWIGKLWDEKLSNLQKAIASYKRVLKIDPANLEALDSLENLFERTGQWVNVIRTVIEKAESAENSEWSVEFYSRAGSLWTNKFHKYSQALKAYSMAITINPLHYPSLAASRDIYTKLGQWEKVVSIYTHEMQFTKDEKAKANLCFRIGKVIENKIKNDEMASLQYEMALHYDSNHLDAIKSLGRILFNCQHWQEAEPYYQKWVKSFNGQGPPEEAARVYYEYGKILQALSRDKEALISYRRSIENNPDYLEPLRARSELYAQRQEWSQALESESQALEILEKQGDMDSAGESLRTMGDFAQRAGRLDDSIEHYTRLLEIAGESTPTIENLIKLYIDRNLYNTAKDLYDRLIAIHDGTPEETQTRLAKGILIEEKIRDNQEALDEYNRLLEVSPDYPEAFYRRAGVLIKLGLWDDAADSAGQLLEIEKEPRKLADAHCLLGRIEQEGRKNPFAAREAYDKALEIEPTHLGAMEAIGMILEASKGWTEYVKIFNKFLGNIPPSAIESTHDIHVRLGQVQRDKLKNYEQAIIEFNNAVKANPDSKPAHAALAKLYLEDKISYPQAIRENQILIEANTFCEEAYHDLAKIYEEQSRPDRAFCIHAILHFFGVLGRWDTTTYEERLVRLPAHLGKHVDDETRERALIHPLASLPATALLGSLGGLLCRTLPASDSPYARLPESHPARKLASEIARNLRVKNYDILQKENNGNGAHWFPGNPPAFVLNTTVFDCAGPRGRRFLVARGLEGVKNGLATFNGLEKAEALKRLQMMVKLFKSEVVVTGMDKSEAQALAKSLKKEVPRKVRKSLEDAAASHHSQERQFPFEDWRDGLVHSANRGGLVISGHPGEALTALLLLEGKIKPGQSLTHKIMKTSEQLAELLRFAVSDQHFIARKRVGLSMAVRREDNSPHC